MSRSVALFVIAAAVILVAVVSVWLFRHAARAALWTQQGNEAQTLAVALASQIDGEAHRKLFQSGDPALYDELLAPLHRAHRRLPELYYVYTLMTTDAGDAFILDTATRPQGVSHGRELEASQLGDVAEDADPPQDHAMRAAMARGESFAYPEPYEDDYGTFMSAHAPIMTSTGELSGFLGVDYDISLIREELRAIDRYAGLAIGAAAILALLIGAAGVVVLQRERTGREVAERYSREQAQFLAMISHDVRTPLHGILGNADLIVHGGDPAAVERRARTIKNCAMTLTTLFNDILDFTKFQRGTVPLNPVQVDCAEVVTEVIDWIRDHANPHGSSIEIEMSADGAMHGWIDPTRLRQIVLNLVGNAAKYGGGNPIEVHLSAGDDVIDLRIVDHGPGINLADQQRIYEPFVQMSERDSESGSGLGLAIVALVLEAMGGSVTLNSILGEGAEFHVTLPRGVEPNRLSAQPSRQSSQQVRVRLAANEVHDAMSEEVLVVDDVDVNREMLREMLSLMGVSAQTEGDAGQAFALAQNTVYRAILLDVHLGETSGIDLCRRIRAEGANTDTPIVMLTGDQFTDTARACTEAGADACLIKPVPLESLVAHVPGASLA